MSPRPGGLSGEVLRVLAAGGGGERAARVLRAGQDARRGVLLRGLLETARAGGCAHAGEKAWRVLADVREREPSAFALVAGYPAVEAAARRVLRGVMGGEAEARAEAAALLGKVAAAAAVRARIRASLTIPQPGRVLVLPSVGSLSLPEGWAGRDVVARTGDGIEILGREGAVRVPRIGAAPGWTPVRALSAGEGAAGITLLLDETDPDRMPGARLREAKLTAAEAARWGALLEDAWEILLLRHWTTAAEARVLLRAFTVLDAPPGRATSGTPRHAPGLIGLSSPVDALGLAETIAHEIQHTKLNAVLDLQALTGTDDGLRYPVAWRTDPRPLLGALHGVYAHLGVAGFWRRERPLTGPRAAVSYARWRDAAHAAALALAGSPSLTAHGRAFLAETTATLASWQAEPVPEAALPA
ncbi:HEXXH motif domain-containing protein [Actinocorallia aurea]